MSDLFDYLAWRGDIPLSQVPFGPVDGLILSTLSYVRFQELVPDSPGLSIPLCQAAEAFLSLPEQEAEDRVRCRQDLRLLKALLSASRFASLPLTFYQDRLDPAREMQFSALTVLLDTGEALLVFRGTDSTLVGWKEDFNLSFLEVVPAQSPGWPPPAPAPCCWPGTPREAIWPFSPPPSPPRICGTGSAQYTAMTAPASPSGCSPPRGIRSCSPASTAMFPSPLWWGCCWSTKSPIPWSKAATLAFSSTTHTPGRCREAASSVWRNSAAEAGIWTSH